MISTMKAVNAAAVVFSLIWLVGHATVRVGDWEFWFAAGYLTLAGVNTWFFMRLGDDSQSPQP